MVSKKCCCWSFSLVFGVTLIVLGIVILVMLPILIADQVKATVPLAPNNKSQTYGPWLKAPVKVYMQFYLFDVLNADEVVAQGAKPSVRQLGPYTYVETRQKVNVTFNKNGTVSYREIRQFHFDEKMSFGPVSREITTLNLPYVVVASKLKNFPSILDRIIEDILRFFDKGLFINKSVHDMIWGYLDPALAKVSTLLKPFGIHLDPNVGLFYGKNNSDDGVYAVDTGVGDLQDFLQVTRWNGMEQLNFWTSPQSNTINGTDGTMFHPFVSPADTLYLFSSDICRSIYAEYGGKTSVRGIPVYRFSPPADVFANSTVNPANQGFCIPNCLGSGVLNMSTCQPGVPAVMSQPHFYEADDKYVNAVKGLHPSEDCRTIIDIEPTTGVLLNAGKKLQINMALEPVAGFTDLDKIKPFFMPMVWINESARVDSGTADKLRDQLVRPILLATSASYVLITAGSLLIFILLIILINSCFCSHRSNPSDQERLISNPRVGLNLQNDINSAPEDLREVEISNDHAGGEH